MLKKKKKKRYNDLIQRPDFELDVFLEQHFNPKM